MNNSIVNKNNIKTMTGTGFGLLIFLSLELLLTPILMFWGINVNPATVIICLVFGGLSSFFIGKYESFILYVICIVWCIALALITFDTASDSIGYHKTSVILLKDGWNLIYDTPDVNNIWVGHYARAQEILSSGLYSLTNILEAGKAVNLIYILSSVFLCYGLIEKIWPYLGNVKSIWITFILMSNPVILTQLFTFYNDIFLYPGLVILFLSMLYIYKYEYHSLYLNWIICISVSIILINSKFTHFFYCGLTWASFYLILLIRHKWNLLKNGLFWGILSLVLGALVIGYNPYITNIIETGDPFYPLLSDSVDIMTSNTPEIYEDDNRFINFFKSQVSTDNESWALIKSPQNLRNYLVTTLDSRTQGFGPLFIILLILSLVIMICCRASKQSWVLYSLTLISCFIFSQSWWARYVPMAWGCLGIAVYVSYSNKKASILRKILIIVVFLNSVVTFARGNAQTILGGFQWRNFKVLSKDKNLKVSCNNNFVIERQLDECNADIEKNRSIEEKSAYTIIGNPENSEMPVMELNDSIIYKTDLFSKFILDYSKLDKSD